MQFLSAEAELMHVMQGKALAAEAERIACVGSWWRNLETCELRWSDGVFRIFGVSKEVFKPSFETFLSMVHPADRPDIEAKVERTIATGEPLDCEYRIVRPDGEMRYAHGRAQIVSVKPAGTKFLVGAVHDITESEKLKKSWFEALDTARELSTPITSIMLCLDAARKLQNMGNPKEGEAIMPALNMAKSNADKAATLVRSLKRSLLDSRD